MKNKKIHKGYIESTVGFYNEIRDELSVENVAEIYNIHKKWMTAIFEYLVDITEPSRVDIDKILKQKQIISSLNIYTDTCTVIDSMINQLNTLSSIDSLTAESHREPLKFIREEIGIYLSSI